MNFHANPSKRFFIKTLGCKVNQYESQAIRELLLKADFKECISEDMADIFILNTCTVTQHADKESRHLAALFHKINPKAKIVVTGCYAENNSEQILFLPGVSHVIRNIDKGRMAEILGPEENIRELAGAGSDLLKVTDFKDHSKAFVRIQDGCENFCSYCKVPFVRGPVRSKKLRDICEEVKGLADKGFNEIVLTGICLGAWGKDLSESDGAGVTKVLKEIEKLGSNFRIRLSSIEPRYVNDELLEYLSDSHMVCRHLHIPLQSGDDEILRRMNRPYTARSYADMIAKAKSMIPDIAITTDVLIGFPGETDAQFKNTLGLVRQCAPSRTHIFTFSRRKGTAAYTIKGDIDRDLLKKRHNELRALALSISYLYRSKFLSRPLNVLVETKRDRLTGMLKGYTDNYIKVHFEGKDDLAKRVVPVSLDYINLMYTFGTHAR